MCFSCLSRSIFIFVCFFPCHFLTLGALSLSAMGLRVAASSCGTWSIRRFTMVPSLWTLLLSFARRRGSIPCPHMFHSTFRTTVLLFYPLLVFRARGLLTVPIKFLPLHFLTIFRMVSVVFLCSIIIFVPFLFVMLHSLP